MKKEVLMIAVVVIMIVVLCSLVYAGDFNINSDVYKKFEKNGKVRLIVEFNEEYKIGGEEKIKNLLGKEKIKHSFENYVSLYGSLIDLGKLKNKDYIREIRLDRPIRGFLDSSIPVINASNVWSLQVNGINLTGIDETVCVLDTGVDFTHPDLIGRNKTCVIDCVALECVEDCSVGDDHGHGTHVAGTVGAYGETSGVSIGVNLIGVKVLDSDGSGYGSDLNAAIQWCTDNSETYNISVISMSLGDCSNHDTFCNADSSASYVNSAVQKNISVVASTGNGPDPPGCIGITNVDGISAPACIENATPVGSVNDADLVFYQRGQLFQLMAPGMSINSTKAGGSYEIRSGTSMAAPHVAGAIAILKQFNKLQNGIDLTSDQIKSVFNSTGKQINDTSGTNLNYPRIDIFSAIVSLDLKSPNVTLITPVNNHLNSSSNISIKCNATDEVLIKNLTLNVWNSSGLYYNSTNSSSGNILDINENVVFSVGGSYLWNCFSYDENNNLGFNSNNNTLIISNITTLLISPVNFYNTSSSLNYFNCSAESIENSSLANISVYIFNSTNDTIYNESKSITGFLNSSEFNFSFTKDENYSWGCLVYNNNSESYFSDNNYSIIYDTSSPIISDLNVLSISKDSGVISYISNENSNSTIRYGLNLSLNNTLGNNTFLTIHNKTISSLNPSTIYYYNITSCDNLNNCVTNGSFNFTTSSLIVIYSDGGSSGGGGSSSGGGSSTSINTYNPTVSEIKKGYSKKLSIGDEINFMIDDVEYKIIVNEIDSNYIKINFNNKNLTFYIRDIKKFNLSSDKYYNLNIGLSDIFENKATLTIKEINERIIIDDKIIRAHEDTDDKNIDDKSLPEEKISKGFVISPLLIINIGIPILIMFILVIIFLLIRKNNKKHVKSNEKIKEYKKTYKNNVKTKKSNIRHYESN
ncbi:S8 family serine peptidase [Candidatus Pacearchaeota archaeon]|nr:S8 family serine peptidase [Candidatus Pacearchaeota archaeon]